MTHATSVKYFFSNSSNTREDFETLKPRQQAWANIANSAQPMLARDSVGARRRARPKLASRVWNEHKYNCCMLAHLAAIFYWSEYIFYGAEVPKYAMYTKVNKDISV